MTMISKHSRVVMLFYFIEFFYAGLHTSKIPEAGGGLCVFIFAKKKQVTDIK